MKSYTNYFNSNFFHEIGKYQVLSRESEKIEIDRIREYKRILAIASTSGNPIILRYLNLIEVRDKLAKKIGRKIQKTQWAKAALISVQELNLIKILACDEWAKVALVSVEELKEIQKNGVAAKEKIILCNLRLVVKISQRYQNQGIDLSDLIQEGILGLEYSIDRFDPTKGWRFTTYASDWIRQSILKAIDRYSRTIRLPRKIIYLLSLIRKTHDTLYAINGEYPSIIEICNRLNKPEKQVRSALEKSMKVSSINIKIDDRGRQKEMLDLIPAQNQDWVLEQTSIQDALQVLLWKLDFKERQVIDMRYLQSNLMTFAEIGEVLEITGEGARKIESRAIKNLRQSLDLIN
jgi:RNA polymerase nonessential primary-like sigma factor